MEYQHRKGVHWRVFFGWVGLPTQWNSMGWGLSVYWFFVSLLHPRYRRSRSINSFTC